VYSTFYKNLIIAALRQKLNKQNSWTVPLRLKLGFIWVYFEGDRCSFSVALVRFTNLWTGQFQIKKTFHNSHAHTFIKSKKHWNAFYAHPVFIFICTFNFSRISLTRIRHGSVCNILDSFCFSCYRCLFLEDFSLSS